MKKLINLSVLFMVAVFFLGFLTACGEKEISQSELADGNWVRSKNRAFVLWILFAKGEWNSSIKIPDVTGKIVQTRGKAKGTWHIEEGQMIVSVLESDVEAIWKNNSTTFFDIVELSADYMRLQEGDGPIIVWDKTTKSQKVEASLEVSGNVISMGPIAVNLNKIRSHDKNRYLCLNLSLILKDMMPLQEIPLITPKAREAAMIFLSSLMFDDVKDFETIKKQRKKLTTVLNSYMSGSIKEIEIEHVIVTVNPDQVEEFMIEHSVAEIVEGEAGEEGEGESEEESK